MHPQKKDSKGMILIPWQVDDFPIGTTDESIAGRITERICEQVKFQHEENPPIAFLGLAEDHDGVEHHTIQ